MIRVCSLHIYPVKSCRGIDVDIAEVAATGFSHDRRWMVADTSGAFLSQRGYPILASVDTRISNGSLLLDAPGRPTLEIALEATSREKRSVTIWKDNCAAVSEGAKASAWFTSLLGTPCELVRQRADAIRQVDSDYADPGDRVAFADGFPFLLISRASVDELNNRLDEGIPADRFRANIIINGCEAHAEDEWSQITIGEIAFRVAKPCARCVVVTTDQSDGICSPEPLRTLAGYRQVDGKVLFGQNLVHRGTGAISVGDEVYPSAIEPRSSLQDDDVDGVTDSENSY